MDFSENREHETIREAIGRICADFGDDYWLQHDREGGFPHELYNALAAGGWLGICMPQEYGGSGMGIIEATVMMTAISRSGAGLSGASSVHMNIFGLQPVVVFGSDEQKRRMLPPLIAGEAVGIGQAALERAVKYANERIVFDRPIGKNQAIQHPLAQSWMELEAAWLMTMRGAWKYDQHLNCAPDANAAKYMAAEAGFNACQRAMATLGGFGYAKEYQVERYLREMLIPRVAPISPQLILCFIAEKVLGLPKSY
jgi:alkylation response protein AidB-like acyl-CoA dehydrogenase